MLTLQILLGVSLINMVAAWWIIYRDFQNVNNRMTVPISQFWMPDGLAYYYVDLASNELHRVKLSEPFDLSTAWHDDAFYRRANDVS